MQRRPAHLLEVVDALLHTKIPARSIVKHLGQSRSVCTVYMPIILYVYYYKGTMFIYTNCTSQYMYPSYTHAENVCIRWHSIWCMWGRYHRVQYKTIVIL